MKTSSFRTVAASSFLLVLFGLCFYLSSTFYPASQSEAEQQMLRVGYLPISPAIPFFVAMEKSFFAQHGLKVEAVKYRNGALLAEDVVLGRIDAASPGPADVYLKKETDTPGRFRIYLQTAYSPENYIYSLVVVTK